MVSQPSDFKPKDIVHFRTDPKHIIGKVSSTNTKYVFVNFTNDRGIYKQTPQACMPEQLTILHKSKETK